MPKKQKTGHTKVVVPSNWESVRVCHENVAQIDAGHRRHAWFLVLSVTAVEDLLSVRLTCHSLRLLLDDDRIWKNAALSTFGIVCQGRKEATSCCNLLFQRHCLQWQENYEYLIRKGYVQLAGEAKQNYMLACRARTATMSLPSNALICCVKDGLYAMVEYLLEQPIAVDTVDTNGKTALTAAIEKQDARLVALVLRHGASTNVGPTNAFYLAADHAGCDVRQLLIQELRSGNITHQDYWQKVLGAAPLLKHELCYYQWRITVNGVVYEASATLRSHFGNCPEGKLKQLIEEYLYCSDSQVVYRPVLADCPEGKLKQLIEEYLPRHWLLLSAKVFATLPIHSEISVCAEGRLAYDSEWHPVQTSTLVVPPSTSPLPCNAFLRYPLSGVKFNTYVRPTLYDGGHWYDRRHHAVYGSPYYDTPRIGAKTILRDLSEIEVYVFLGDAPFRRQSFEQDVYCSDNCVVCLAEPPAMIYLPCRHMCMCQKCAKQYRNRLCPICRKTIDSFLNEAMIPSTAFL